MNKLIEKLKQILPSTKNIILSHLALFIACFALAFVHINNFNISNVFLTFLVCFCIALVIEAICALIIYLLPKIIKVPLFKLQYITISTYLFAIEIALLSLISFLLYLLSPIAFVIANIILISIIAAFNIVFLYNYGSEITQNKQKLLTTIKFYNIIIVLIVFAVWAIL